MTTLVARCRRLIAAAAFLALIPAADASAQGIVSPFLGSTFSGPALACGSLTGCEEGSTTYGVGLGTLGSFFGFELDLGYTKAFLGEVDEEESSSMLTVMGNLIVGPKIGPVQPYGVGGLGMLKLSVDPGLSALLEDSETKLAWDLGGGIIVFFGEHVGVRGDIRYFRTLQDFDFLPLLSAGGGAKMDFNRATAAVVFKF